MVTSIVDLGVCDNGGGRTRPAGEVDMSGVIPDGSKLMTYLMWGDVQLRTARHRLGLLRCDGRWHAVITPVWLKWQVIRIWRVTDMVRKLMLMVALFSVIASAQGAGPLPEKRSAYAEFRQVDGCTAITTLVQLAQTQRDISPDFPDGWARAAWLTVEVDDTCAGIQQLNAAGQLDAQPQQLSIDRKLATADLSGVVAVWDGISKTQGQIAVTVHWDATGPLDRSVWRTVQRSANATIAADGMGVQLRNATSSAWLKSEK